MNFDASHARLVGIDWGTSSLRAYLIDSQGGVLDKLYAPEGIMQVQNHDFVSVLTRLLEPWLKKMSLPVIASGMITSRNGWVETPYLALPTSARQLADSLQAQRTPTGLQVHFVTGVNTNHGGAPDVMRGEETQIVGAVESGLTDGLFVMPGTHSKWVAVRGGCIEEFATYMSGEVFAALRGHTILGTLMKDTDFNLHGFELGVKAGFDAGAQLLHKLFHVRTLPLFDLISEDEVSDYLSGMLIGAEISGATDNNLLPDRALGNAQVTIVGLDKLADRYAVALEALDRKVAFAGDDIAARGHFAIAKSAGLI